MTLRKRLEDGNFQRPCFRRGLGRGDHQRGGRVGIALFSHAGHQQGDQIAELSGLALLQGGGNRIRGIPHQSRHGGGLQPRILELAVFGNDQAAGQGIPRRFQENGRTETPPGR